ncbi:MAG: Lipoprotein signal peptidase [Firmicutes bacterium ADurb.Bin506]|nr:MAG: Lipoprotein signal peptidase [Firmicutes bacterium ADurb.Bin506]
MRWLAVSGFILAVDQVTKNVVGRLVAEYEVVPCLGGLVNITNVRNFGAAFGVFQNARAQLIAVAAVTAIAGVYFLITLPRDAWVTRFGVSLAVGGALGNLIDRVRFGGVFDFIEVSPLPIFNLADMAIVFGVALILLSVLFHPRVKEE